MSDVEEEQVIMQENNDNEDETIKEEIEQIISEISKEKIPPYREQDIMSKKRYVLGFAMNPNRTEVLLIKKNRPEWQAGLFNGIGGKIETSDLSESFAMQREFKEETGLDVAANQWTLFSVMENNYFKVSVFWTIIDNLNDYQNLTDEEVSIVQFDHLYSSKFKNCINNLSWLVGLLLDDDLKKMMCHIYYQENS